MNIWVLIRQVKTFLMGVQKVKKNASDLTLSGARFVMNF
jgi:hypothetical protein